jgi:hypothetical protein
MIALMGGPFRFNKKTRKRMRKFAKKESVLADKIETESFDQPNWAPSLRRSAERNLTLAKLHKKKKSKNPK